MTPDRQADVEDPAGTPAPFGARANASARRRFAPRYLLNTLRNIPRIAASADVGALAGAFPACPAVVVAAGPSLDGAIGWLRELPSHVLVVAVDTAARPLLEAGIAPHVVVAVDPSDLNARHLRHLPDTGRTWLVAEGSLDPGAFEWFGGRSFTFCVSDHEPWPWLRSTGLGRGRLRAWGSVLTTAVDLALQAGCSPIAFAGADLAYTGGRPYCRGTVYEHDWARRVAAGERLETVWLQVAAAKARRLAEDVHGRRVPTSAALLSFRDWIVEQSTAHPHVRFLNGTGDGILRGGRIEQVPLPAIAALLGDGTAARQDPRTRLREAWQRGHATAADAAAHAHPALARLAQAPGAVEPIPTWCRFAAPDLLESTVRRALAEAAADLERPSARTATGPTVLAAGAPERASLIRAALTGQPLPVAVTSAPAVAPQRPEACERVGRTIQERVRTCLAAVVTSPDRLTLPDAVTPATPMGVAAVHAHPWTSAALPLVLGYEAALADLAAAPRGTAADVDRWLRVAPGAVLSSTRDSGEPAIDAPADTAARLGLVADALAVAATCGARAPHAEHPGHATLPTAAAVLRAYAAAVDCSLQPSDTATRGSDALLAVTVSGRRYVQPCGCDARGVAAALTGALVRVHPDAAVRPAPHRLPPLSITLPAVDSGDAVTLSLSMTPAAVPTAAERAPAPAWLPAARGQWPDEVVLPVRVNTPAMPCMIGSTWDEAHALFTVVNGTGGIRIGEDGAWVPDTEWPCPISGQVRWGAAGAIAWHSGDRRVVWREHPDGAVHAAPMPVAGARAFPHPDGTILWTSVRGGLWSWTPGCEWRCLVDTPPLMGLQASGDHLRLEPRGQNLSFAVREPLTEAFAWTPGADRVTVLPLGPEGPCWDTARAGAWTALAYPHADAVLLRHVDGGEQVLTCHYPFNVAWAGPSLVVSTGEGSLWAFRDLLTRLTRDV